MLSRGRARTMFPLLDTSAESFDVEKVLQLLGGFGITRRHGKGHRRLIQTACWGSLMVLVLRRLRGWFNDCPRNAFTL